MDIKDLGPLPFVNPRQIVFEEARRRVSESLLSIFAEYDLSSAERLFILSREMDYRLASLVVQDQKQYAIKQASS